MITTTLLLAACGMNPQTREERGLDYSRGLVESAVQDAKLLRDLEKPSGKSNYELALPSGNVMSSADRKMTLLCDSDFGAMAGVPPHIAYYDPFEGTVVTVSDQVGESRAMFADDKARYPLYVDVPLSSMSQSVQEFFRSYCPQ